VYFRQRGKPCLKTQIKAAALQELVVLREPELSKV
jgi:hypothetical protein